MGFVDGIFAWFLKLILEYLVSKAAKESKDALDKLKKDSEQEKINEENVKAYEEASNREERRKAALRLINGDKP